MYDKVKLIYRRTSQTPDVSQFLDVAKEQTNLNTGEVCIFGSLEGLKVGIFPAGISVIGSLPKYLYPNNIYPLDRITTVTAIEKLSDALHLDMNEARVTGLEFGGAFMMRQPIENYLSRLGDMPRLERSHLAGTLYYLPKAKRQIKAFCFYDKIADAAAKGMALPAGFEGANLLKYEMRFSERLTKQLREPEITASTLSERAFYSKLVKLYQENYFSIHKSKQVKTDVMSQIKTVTDAFDVFVARLISQSDKTQIAGFLDELKANNVFADRKSYTRLKNKIEDVSTKAGITVSDDLMKELDDEVKNVGAYV